MLAVAGGVLGAAVVYTVLDGYTASTLNPAAGSQLAFAFRVTPESIGLGLAWAIAVGVIGGLDSLEARIANQREQEVVAEREIDVRRTAREDTVIRAPFSGVAISRDAQPGEIISPMSAGGGFTRTGVCTIVDMSSLEIEVDVNESYIDRVSPGQRVLATLNAYPDWEIPARVITTIPAADRQRATVLVRIGFEEFGDPRILPDMGVNVAFLESGPPEEEVPGATPRLWIPSEALRSDGGRSVVFVVRGETVERRSVTTGLEDGGDVEVLAGVSAGERVVVEGPPVLAGGDRVVAD